jgi:hypothetical protein
MPTKFPHKVSVFWCLNHLNFENWYNSIKVDGNCSSSGKYFTMTVALMMMMMMMIIIIIIINRRRCAGNTAAFVADQPFDVR